MLVLKNIVKDYVAGDSKVRALREMSINFRENEFVSILGPSGCGKTTLLNIIGGLDRYTSGDLIINGKSTESFTDSDWDTYRNHSIGFVFQSYNLIPHQTVLANVELALTLTGVSKKERRAKAIAALNKVGLNEQIYKKPNQMSGGQMQRVAIARALINDPDILLADEPTGALDSETSVQIMEILKEISKDKLIIMVTHNPELAEQYSNRIIRCLDGQVVGDSNPFVPKMGDYFLEKKRAEEEKLKGKKPSMSLKTAFGLSIRNLGTKKGRTILTCFAGSIGIIGIALVLALSTGIQAYVDKVQTDALTAYPMSIEESSMDIESMVNSFTGMVQPGELDHDRDNIYMNEMFASLLNEFINKSSINNIKAFKKYIEDNQAVFDELCNDIQYKYETDLNIYVSDTSSKIVQVNPSTLLDAVGASGVTDLMESFTNSSVFNIWKELIGNRETLEEQYDLIYGRYPEAKNEVVLITDANNEINDLVVYGLGLKDQSELVNDVMNSLSSGTEMEGVSEEYYTYEDICSRTFKLVFNSDYMVKDSKTGLWKDMRNSKTHLKKIVDNGMEIKIVGILRADEDNMMSIITGAVGYTSELMEYALEYVASSQVVQEQLNNQTVDVITGNTFNTLTVNDFDLKDINFEDIDLNYLDISAFTSLLEDIDMSNLDISSITSMSSVSGLLGDMTDLQKKLVEGYLNDQQVLAIKQAYVDTLNSKCSYEATMATLGYELADSPTSIYFYAKSFDAKKELSEVINYYNEQVTADGHKEYAIEVTDAVGAMLSLVTTMINIVTYVLVIFVAISLVVSSIMIGIITYISVLERTKEIGILRAIGASKGDVASVFNAETLTIGFASGVLGIVCTLLIELPINILLEHFTASGAAAQLPFTSALALIGISVFLTFIAGLVPSSMAAKKDPVEALRTD